MEHVHKPSSDDAASSPKMESILEDHVRRPYFSSNAQLQLSWQRLQEVPSGHEILSAIDERTLPHNIVDGAWGSKVDYVRTQYRLLRFDAIRALQDSVAEFSTAPNLDDTRNTCIYTHVYIVGYTYNQTGAAARIEFSTERAGKRIRWEQSKRLQQGTLVALSPVSDCFRTICRAAIVAARPLASVTQNPPQIDLFWSSHEEAESDPAVQYVMIESKTGYFEASRHMLVALQKVMDERFGLSDYFIRLKQDVDAPEFVKYQPFMNLESLSTSTYHRRHPSFQHNGIANVHILDDWPVIDGSILDNSQLEAVKRILTKKVAIIQGPPGTGKTFVSVTALKLMLCNWKRGDPPIVVSAQTNHALDQILMQVLEFEADILRLGGRSNEDNEDIKGRTLYSLRRTSRFKSDFDPALHRAKKALEKFGSEKLTAEITNMVSQDADEPQRFFELGIITLEQFQSIHDPSWSYAGFGSWLSSGQKTVPRRTPKMGDIAEEEDEEYEELNDQEQEARRARDDDEEADSLRGPFFPYSRIFVGASKPIPPTKIRELLRLYTDLWEIPDGYRGTIYEYMKFEASKKYLERFRSQLAQYNSLADNVKILKWQCDLELIKSQRIKLIGCTTTGLSKYRGLIAALKPRTLLIEEAAETLEGTVLAGMFDSVQQLILVGDHLQLQAHCNNDFLGKKPFNLAVSLFERLIKNGLEFTILNCQRRMRTELRQLLSPLYPQLTDHSSVLEKRNKMTVPGMGKRNSLMFCHCWPESRDDTLSRLNKNEGDLVAAFVNYLTLNGTDIEKITILTFYNGQRRYLLRALRKLTNLKNVPVLNVFTVDSYQGEENDIVILSLVRANSENSIGFLENRNRAVVALSRARVGLYIFGDLSTLISNEEAESYDLWNSVAERFISTDRMPYINDVIMRPYLPVVCQKHHNELRIFSARDFEGRAGCEDLCGEKLPCGHDCIFTCHPFDHYRIICQQECRKLVQGCPERHQCVMKCNDQCRCPCGPLQAGHTHLSEDLRGYNNTSITIPPGGVTHRFIEVDEDGDAPPRLPHSHLNRGVGDMLPQQGATMHSRSMQPEQHSLVFPPAIPLGRRCSHCPPSQQGFLPILRNHCGFMDPLHAYQNNGCFGCAPNNQHIHPNQYQQYQPAYQLLNQHQRRGHQQQEQQYRYSRNHVIARFRGSELTTQHRFPPAPRQASVAHIGHPRASGPPPPLQQPSSRSRSSASGTVGHAPAATDNLRVNAVSAQNLPDSSGPAVGRGATRSPTSSSVPGNKNPARATKSARDFKAMTLTVRGNNVRNDMSNFQNSLSPASRQPTAPPLTVAENIDQTVGRPFTIATPQTPLSNNRGDPALQSSVESFAAARALNFRRISKHSSALGGPAPDDWTSVKSSPSIMNSALRATAPEFVPTLPSRQGSLNLQCRVSHSTASTREPSPSGPQQAADNEPPQDKRKARKDLMGTTKLFVSRLPSGEIDDLTRLCAPKCAVYAVDITKPMSSNPQRYEGWIVVLDSKVRKAMAALNGLVTEKMPGDAKGDEILEVRPEVGRGTQRQACMRKNIAMSQLNSDSMAEDVAINPRCGKFAASRSATALPPLRARASPPRQLPALAIDAAYAYTNSGQGRGTPASLWARAPPARQIPSVPTDTANAHTNNGPRQGTQARQNYSNNQATFSSPSNTPHNGTRTNAPYGTRNRGRYLRMGKAKRKAAKLEREKVEAQREAARMKLEQEKVSRGRAGEPVTEHEITVRLRWLETLREEKEAKEKAEKEKEKGRVVVTELDELLAAVESQKVAEESLPEPVSDSSDLLLEYSPEPVPGFGGVSPETSRGDVSQLERGVDLVNMNDGLPAEGGQDNSSADLMEFSL